MYLNDLIPFTTGSKLISESYSLNIILNVVITTFVIWVVAYINRVDNKFKLNANGNEWPLVCSCYFCDRCS